MIVCKKILFSGIVQGVGFRPFVYRTAVRMALHGWVGNTVKGVAVTLWGSEKALQAFTEHITHHCPPLARINTVAENFVTDAGEEPEDFHIVVSEPGDNPSLEITADTATCDACVHELFDPTDRRFHHPFINCTNCGPRYTIIKDLPYDRPATTMGSFSLCPHCKSEYENPLDRRFHAQPVCCPQCGPELLLCDALGKPLKDIDPIEESKSLLADGKIVAVKGIGGFHIVCRADNERAVQSLRDRKNRAWKPLAIMARSEKEVRRICTLSEPEREMLTSAERPVLILTQKNGQTIIARGVAPNMGTLGVMLPYTPIHHLLFDTDAYDYLVMTSGNVAGEPICCGNDEALEKLSGLVDAFCMHDRDIEVRVDDSVVRFCHDAPIVLRRARGFVPLGLPAGCVVDNIIAAGAIEKNTVTLGRGETCFVSQFLGHASFEGTVVFSEEIIAHYQNILGIVPHTLVLDLHPAAENQIPRNVTHINTVLRVQHHHAHAAACLAENRIDKKAVCVIFDGVGYGEDGSLWGGEFFIADRSSYERAGHVRPMVMPGGDAAARYPARMALGALWPRYGKVCRALIPGMAEDEFTKVISVLDSAMNCPVTSSMGRLFDAASALCGICFNRTYEGQPAMELEEAAFMDESGSYDVRCSFEDGMWIVEGDELLYQLAMDLQSGIPVPVTAARFHNAVVAVTVSVATSIADYYGLDTVAFSGGCFINKRLFSGVVEGIQNHGLTPVYHSVLSPGDECVSFGQAIVAGERLRKS